MDEGVEERCADPQKGKGLFARRDFQKGQAIITEIPLVCCQFAWNEDCGYRCCEYCCCPLETAQENAKRLSGISDLILPYPNLDAISPQNFQTCGGCGVGYCSATCKDQAWSRYHRTLCHSKANQSHPLEILRNGWKEMHYPPESFNIMILAKLAAMYVQADAKNREELLGTLGRFQSGIVNADQGIMHKMLGPGFQGQLEKLRRLFSLAFEEDCLKGWWSPDSFLSFLAIFARNAQGVGTSAFGMWQMTVKKVHGSDPVVQNLVDAVYAAIGEKTGEEFMDNEGSALYVRQRACNHSCEPNTEIAFPGNNFILQLTAIEKIQAGEEIFISYLSECQLERSRHSRQKALREYYLFNCTCSKCQQEANQADTSSEEEEWEDDDEREAMQEEE